MAWCIPSSRFHEFWINALPFVVLLPHWTNKALNWYPWASRNNPLRMKTSQVFSSTVPVRLSVRPTSLKSKWNQFLLLSMFISQYYHSFVMTGWWSVHNDRCQLHQISMHTETIAHVHHFSRMLKRLCEPQEKICCLYIFWKLFGST